MDQDDADDKEIKYHLDPNYTYSPVYVSPQDGLKDDDKISELPAQPDGTDFDQYSGYVTVEADRRKALFYYLTESPTNSSTNPLLLWLQGVTVSFMEMEFCEFSPELSTRRQLLKDNIEGEADPTAKRTKQQQ